MRVLGNLVPLGAGGPEGTLSGRPSEIGGVMGRKGPRVPASCLPDCRNGRDLGQKGRKVKADGLTAAGRWVWLCAG